MGLIHKTYKFGEDRMTHHKFIKNCEVKKGNPEPLLETCSVGGKNQSEFANNQEPNFVFKKTLHTLVQHSSFTFAIGM